MVDRGHSARAGSAMGRHIRDDDLLCCVVPSIVDPQATRRVPGIAAALDVPIRFEPATVEIESERVGSAMTVLNAGFDVLAELAAASKSPVSARSS